MRRTLALCLALLLPCVGDAQGFKDLKLTVTAEKSQIVPGEPVVLCIKVTNSTFALTVTAKDNYLINGASLAEAGDYFFFGANSGVKVAGQLRGRSLDAAGAPIITNGIAASSFAGNADFAITTSNANISKRVDDFWRRGIQTIPAEA